MDRNSARRLWHTIITHAEAKAAVEGEGNSGEFHDPREAARLEDDLKRAREALIRSFTRLTRWEPEERWIKRQVRDKRGRVKYSFEEPRWFMVPR